jgi:hypothetical protein
MQLAQHVDSLMHYVSQMDELMDAAEKLQEENRRLEEFVSKTLSHNSEAVDKVFDEYCGPNAFPYLRNLLKKELGFK